jgi:serine/threonine-protein kinase
MIGKTISHYKILEKLGEGGMGVVYKAEDTKLRRDVALKFLPSNVLQGKEEKNRFTREAQAAAALNHANIAHIYAIEEFDDQMFIAMEFIKGQSLAEIVGANGGSPLPLEKAIGNTTQIAAGLQAAHEKDVVHRDIKSANIMVTDKGVVKIMDFGLAKLADRSRMTMEGSTVGTVAYMSPEQARGEEVDHRSDIWSLGVVLYEMITGQLPFKGEYEQSVIFAILNNDPEPLTALRSGVPIALDGIISKAMAKDTKVRYQHVDELPADLNGMDTTSVSITKTNTIAARANDESKPRRKQLMTAGLLGLVIGIIFTSIFLGILIEDSSEVPLRKFQIPLNSKITLETQNSISPDGTMIVFNEFGNLWIRYLSQIEARKIPETDGALWSFWSPESDYIGYLDTREKKLKKVKIDGSDHKTICDFPFGEILGAVWGSDKMIVFNGGSDGLYEVAASGGKPKRISQTNYVYPIFLPDEEESIIAVRVIEDSHIAQIIEDTSFVLSGISDTGFGKIAYSPSGHLLYDNPKGLWGIAFSLSNFAVSGKPFQINSSGVSPSVSNDGTLVYTISSFDRLVLVNRQGVVVNSIGETQKNMWYPAISPDMRKVAVSAEQNGNRDIWIHDAITNTMEPFTRTPGQEQQASWSTDGKFIIYESVNKLFKKSANGRDEPVQIPSGPHWSYEPNWSRDGKYVFYHIWNVHNQTNPTEQWYLSLDGQIKPQPFIEGPGEIGNGMLSPKNEFLAYQSSETGYQEIYITTFPDKDRTERVSIKGGMYPRWSHDGDELFYVEMASNSLMAVSVYPRSNSMMIDQPKKLFSGNKLGVELGLEAQWTRNYDVAPDGKHFVIVQPVDGVASKIIVAQNWYEEFKTTNQ